ncbi:hypothetical protein K4F52_009090 [Lecanicillium sp. MT-2017a]|nr:hypothetical protein K4F52_009090 [Lecanicillium sp. MT-2017a]
MAPGSEERPRSLSILKNLYRQLAEPTDTKLARNRHSSCPMHSKRDDEQSFLGRRKSASETRSLSVEPLRFRARPRREVVAAEESIIAEQAGQEHRKRLYRMMQELLDFVNAEIATRMEWTRMAREAAERGARRLKKVTRRSSAR